ncbi:polysaccharide biosynthesis C-terminal domain-containing protein, partial [Candidatus Woesearchaeota archaeon]|nr:polysaccharide biosynthesis C-terminal domain-containing protein [Candidatus Woesearchaeota archaeon]
FYGIPELSSAFKIVSPLIVFYAFFTFMSHVYIGLHKNQYSLIGNLTNGIALIVFPLVFFLTGMGLNGVVSAVVISFIVAAIVISLPLLIKLNHILSNPTTKIKRNKVNTDVFYFTILSLLTLFLYWGILVLLGFFVIPEDVAFFKVSLSLFMAVGILVPISNLVVFSSIVGLKITKKTKKLRNYMSRVMKYGFIITFPSMLGLFVLGDSLVRVIYGTEFLRAGLSLGILCWALVAQFVTNIFYGYLAESRLKQVSKIYIFSTIVGVIFSIPAIHYFGLFGASLSFVFIYFIIAFLLYIPVYQDLRINFVKYTYRPLVASLVMAGIVYYLEPFIHSIIEAFLLILLGIVSYFAVLYLIRGITKEDIKILKYLR